MRKTNNIITANEVRTARSGDSVMQQSFAPRWPVTTVGTLDHNWSFVPSVATPVTWLLRLRARWLRRGPPPPSRILKRLLPQARWSAVFLYLPDGQLTPSHRYMLDRLRQRAGGLLVICAAPDAAMVPSVLHDLADALIWKGLAGFDFSAYAIAIDAVAAASPGADLFVVNDSVLGPFGDLDATLAAMPWDLSGFTASAWHENHLQSYAFHLRGVTPQVAAALAPVISPRFAHERYRDVILAQETRFARVASRRMSVGTLWYGPREMGDPSLHAALSLVEHGFPFLKRKLFFRDAGLFSRDTLSAFLEEHRHPVP